MNSKHSDNFKKTFYLLDSHKHLCEHLSELKGVDETTAYKCNLKI